MHPAETLQAKSRDLEMRPLHPLKKIEGLVVRKGPDFLCTNSFLVRDVRGSYVQTCDVFGLWKSTTFKFDDLLSVFFS